MNFGNKARRIVKAASFQPSHSSSGRDKPRRVVKASFQHASRPKSGRTRSSRLRSATFLVRSTTQFAGRRTRPQSASSRLLSTSTSRAEKKSQIHNLTFFPSTEEKNIPKESTTSNLCIKELRATIRVVQRQIVQLMTSKIGRQSLDAASSPASSCLQIDQILARYVLTSSRKDNQIAQQKLAIALGKTLAELLSVYERCQHGLLLAAKADVQSSWPISSPQRGDQFGGGSAFLKSLYTYIAQTTKVAVAFETAIAERKEALKIVENLEGDNATLKDEIEMLKTVLRQGSTAPESSSSALSRTRTRVKQTITIPEKTHESPIYERATVRSETVESSTCTTPLQKRVDIQHNAEISQLKWQLEQANKKNETLKNQCDRLTAQLEMKTAEVKTVKAAETRKQTALWTLKRNCVDKDKDMEELRLQLSDLRQRAGNLEVSKNDLSTQVKDELEGLRSTVTELRHLLGKSRQAAAAASEQEQETQKLLEKEIEDASAARARHKQELDSKAKALLTERHCSRKLAAKAKSLEEKLRLAARRESQKTDTGLTEQIQQYLAEIASLKQAMLAQRKDSNKKIETIKQKMFLKQNQTEAQHKKQIGSVESQLAALRVRFTSKEKVLTKIQKTADNLLKTNDELRTKYEHQREMLNKSNTETKDIRHLRDELLAVKNRCLHLQTSYDTERQQNTQLEGRVRELEASEKEAADLKRILARKERSTQEIDDLKVQIKGLQDKEKKLKYEWTIRFTKLGNDSRRKVDKVKADADARVAAVEASKLQELAALKTALSKQRVSVATSPVQKMPSASALENLKIRLTKTEETLKACQIKLRGQVKQVVPALRKKVEEQLGIIKSLRIRVGELTLDLDHWKLSHSTVQRELQKKENAASSEMQLAQSKTDAVRERELRMVEELRVCREQIQKLTDDLSTANMCLKMRRKESDAKQKSSSLDEEALKLQLEQVRKERAMLMRRNTEIEQMREQMLKDQKFLQNVEKTMYNRLRQQLELVEMHETLEQDAATLGEQEWQNIHQRVSTLQEGIAEKDQQMRQMESTLEESLRRKDKDAGSDVSNAEIRAGVLRVREVVRASRENNDKRSKQERNKRQFTRTKSKSAKSAKSVKSPKSKSGSGRNAPNKFTVPVTKKINRQARRASSAKRYRDRRP